MNRKINLIILVALLLFGSFKPMTIEKPYQIEKQKMDLETFLSRDKYVKLEMKKMASGHLHLIGQLNGVSGDFILDTGAGGTVIEEKNKEKFKMRARNTEQEATGAGGTGIQVQVSKNNILKLGVLELKDQNLMLMNLDHVNNAFERIGIGRVDGVIGADILTEGEAIIDYSNLILYLKSPF